MSAATIKALFIGTDPRLTEVITAIRQLEHGVSVHWSVSSAPEPGPAELSNVDVVAVDEGEGEGEAERLWSTDLRQQLQRVRQLAPNSTLVLLYSEDRPELGPLLRGIDSISLVARTSAALDLPGLLSQSHAKKVETPTLRKQILIIDDSYDDRELYTRTLRRATQAVYTAVEAPDGAQGIELLRRITPDCILLDYSLPGRNGLDVLRNIREEWPDIPVVILTGHGNEAVAVEAMKNGAQDYVIKSDIDEDMLHRVIKSACETHALQRRVVQQRDTLALFTRALAHDLKEPLRTISSYVDIVRSSGDNLSPRNYGFLGNVSSAAAHMERLVEMVTNYARLEAESGIAELELCDPVALIQQAMKNVAQHASDVSHTLVLGELPIVYANPVQLTNVFQNLISNALNYGDKPMTEIRISCTTREQHHIFTLEDNGAGIDPRYTHQLFQPFKRLSSAGHTRGSGLGLALCKRIVENHVGRIWLESKLGLGTKVHFTLPVPATARVLSPASADPREVPAVEAEQRDLANVLLVEDNEADVVLTQVLLQETDGLLFNVYSVSNGELALRWLTDPNQPRIDLILLDINMPVMDGFAFLQALRRDAERWHVPVIMCSTSTEQADQSRAQKLGVAAYVTKPLRLQELEAPLQALPTLVVNREYGGGIRLERRGS